MDDYIRVGTESFDENTTYRYCITTVQMVPSYSILISKPPTVHELPGREYGYAPMHAFLLSPV